ncbi:MAG TPA: chemotaxis protein CheB [Planctomycetota bacterium]|nr:chemotaxis protein CheB [Planctomycetota bacterium]
MAKGNENASGRRRSAARKARPKSPEERAKLSPKRDPVSVVGVGASAGGLEAFSDLLQALPERPGFALVLVQHLAPAHTSSLPELLSRQTSLPVVQAKDGMRVEVDHVYVIPPNAQLELGERLRLRPRPSGRAQFNPIDLFFSSLAKERGARSIGVVFSGTASDGTSGLREIKAAGGVALAQDPDTARYSGMPSAAIASGVVDLVLSPRQMAAELVRLARHSFVSLAVPRVAGDELGIDGTQLQRIFHILRAANGVDFTHYKPRTIQRRLQRRMVLHKLTDAARYVRYLEEDEAEVQALYRDLLIHVTHFFRDPETIEALQRHVFPKILAAHVGSAPIRIWVPGCASGEEAHLIAIALLEFLSEKEQAVPVQIFATDVSESSLEVARAGTYPASIEADVSPERLRRFFRRSDGSYTVAKPVRDMCVFARQDLTRDPPFSQLDLIVCRNVLIYLGPALQKRLLTSFHYALKPTGFLMLGRSESVGPASGLFQVDKTHKLYTKKLVDLPATAYAVQPWTRSPGLELPRRKAGYGPSLALEADRRLLERFAPPAVLVNKDLQILQFRGRTGTFLEPAPGDANLNVLRMAREGVLQGLRSALDAARKSGAPARKEGLAVRAGSDTVDFDLEVMPLEGADEEHSFLIAFEERTPDRAPAPPRKAAGRRRRAEDPDARVRRLEQDLDALREFLQSTIQEVETGNEELQSANEEILSSNEELQSTNEELDTAKEELQSTNEELNTVNDELQGRNEELTRLNSDLVNLLGSVHIAIVMLSSDLRIRRFTPAAERLLNLIPSDVGRPIGHIKPNLVCPDLGQLVSEVIDSVVTREMEVSDGEGHWYSLRVRPYKSLDSRIDGAVLALFDVSSAKHHEQALEAARRYAEAIVETIREPLLVVDSDLTVRSANPAFLQRFGLEEENVLRRPAGSLLGGDRGLNLVELIADVLREGRRLRDFEFEQDLPGIGRRRILINARRIEGEGERPALALLAFDVTEPL